MVNHITYDSFGNVTSETAAVDHLFGYTGRAYDEETDLQNNHNRWYDAANGKWLSEDPIGFAGGDANLYRYVGNSATNATDPSGLEPKLGKYVATCYAPVAAAIASQQAALNQLIQAGTRLSNAIANNPQASRAIQTAQRNFDRAARAYNQTQAVAERAIRRFQKDIVIQAPDKVREGCRKVTNCGQRAIELINRYGSNKLTPKQAHKVFAKHGADFGLSGNWSPSRAADVVAAINKHVCSAGTSVIPGTYRGSNVLHHLDPKTGLNVVTDLSGKFIGGWKLGANHLESVLKNGRLF